MVRERWCGAGDALRRMARGAELVIVVRAIRPLVLVFGLMAVYGHDQPLVNKFLNVAVGRR